MPGSTQNANFQLLTHFFNSPLLFSSRLLRLMAVAFHPIGNCVSISDLYQIVSYFLLYCNKVKNILSNPQGSYVIAM